jgi:hypothetical protein
MEKKEYICELQYVRAKWVFKVVRLYIYQGRFFEVGVFVRYDSVFVGCLYYGHRTGYGVEFMKHRMDEPPTLMIEADFSDAIKF